MQWVIEQSNFKHEMDKIILDYLDYGNCFATVEWLDQRVEQPLKPQPMRGTPDMKGTYPGDPPSRAVQAQFGYVGPSIRRINPLNLVMNPTSENFTRSPKIVRSIISIGELRDLLSKMSNDENREEFEELYEYLKNIRFHARESKYELDTT